MPGTFQVTVVTPEKQVLDEEAVYASVPAWDGLLGVQTRRAPLLIKVGYGPLRLDLADGSTRTFFAGSGFAQMKNNVLTLLLDEATPADEVSTEQAQAALQEALALRGATEALEAKRERDLGRARGMLAVANR